MYTISGLFWAEAVNYLEHYGLRRRVISDVKTEDGKEVFESIDGYHSWNAPASTLAFKIQRHSDHHAHSFRPYQILRHFNNVPALPYEYILMLWLSICPPMFMYMMDPRIAAINRAKEGKPNDDEDKWCNSMPMSKADKWRDLVAKTYFLVVSIAFTAMVWYKGW